MATIQNIIIEKFTKEESVSMEIKINSGSQEITANTSNFGFLKVKPSKMPQTPTTFLKPQFSSLKMRQLS